MKNSSAAKESKYRIQRTRKQGNLWQKRNQQVVKEIQQLPLKKHRNSCFLKEKIDSAR
jgi:hypothetical protein